MTEEKPISVYIRHECSKFRYADACARLATTILLRAAETGKVDKDEIEIAHDLMAVFDQYCSLRKGVHYD